MDYVFCLERHNTLHFYVYLDGGAFYFASVFGFPGSGFTGAILAGYRTARKILDPYFYPRRLSLCVLFGTAVSMGITELIQLLF